MTMKLAGDLRLLEELAITHIFEIGAVVLDGFDDKTKP